MACNEHLVEVAEQSSTLPGRVVGVAFAAPASVERFERRLSLGVLILCDPGREAYRLLGFGRRSGWLALLRPTYWARLAQALARGRGLRRVREDPGQLGGDAVLDAELVLRWIYRSRWPADRPTVDQVRQAMLRAGDRRS